MIEKFFTIVGVIVVGFMVLCIIAMFFTKPDEIFDDSKLHGK